MAQEWAIQLSPPITNWGDMVATIMLVRYPHCLTTLREPIIC